MFQSNKSGVVNAHKVLFTLLALLSFAGMVFWGCSSKDSEPEINSNSSNSSSSQEGGIDSSSSDGSNNPNVSSSSDGSNNPDVSSSSDGSSSSGISSSSQPPLVTDPGANCTYQPSWCGGITYGNVKKTSMDAADVGAQDKGQERPNCIYATAIVQIGNESGGISINGTQFATGSASRCGGDNGHGYGSTTACATKFASVTKADGGYYIYVPAWAGQNFKTTGGEPVCSGTIVSPSSSSEGGSTSACVEPMYGVPPNGVKSCVKKDGKCYTCNPDRGNECSQAWIWQVNNVEAYWHVEVSCNESSTPTYTLTCANLAQTGVAGTTITQPTVKCNGDNVTANFTNAPTWSSPAAGTYSVNATANCGGSNKQVSCGTIVVSAAPTASDLTCTGLAQTGVAGTAITQPTVKCGTATVSSSSVTFTVTPTTPTFNWANPAAGTYAVSASSTCGGSNKQASCGTIKVNPKLACGNPSPQTVIAGTKVTEPAVTCGSATVVATANVSWSGAPTYWSAPDAGTYNNIKATANAGDCSGQTATCGTLTVNSKLTCDAVTQAITTGQTPAKPTVKCGTATVSSSSVTWSPTSINSAINTAQTISNVTATASCGGSNQIASCSGTITVTAPSTPSSSSTGGGGNPSYTPTTPGTSTAKTTQYWDACKPSCSWSGNAGGNPANSCNITGTNLGHSDSDRSACDNGSAFTCMKQAPWKVGNVSFGYAAINMGKCGDCYQLNFPNNEVMVVMKSNIGNLNEGAAFDLMIPGGGVGDFDALTRQVTNSGVNNPNMGERYGGFRGACGWNYSTSNVECVRTKCNQVFANLPDLKAGCLWYANTLGTDNASWNNPVVNYKQVPCPSELTNKY